MLVYQKILGDSMAKTLENNFIEIVSQTFNKIKEEKFALWQEEMEQEITHRFMFNNMFSIENISKTETPKYKLVNLKSLHSQEAYETIGDFLDNFNGNKKWDEDYGFETYYIELKQDWVNFLLEELDTNLRSLGVTDEIPVDLDDQIFKELLVDTVEDFWAGWVENSFAQMLPKYVDKVLEEDRQISIEVDMANQEEDRRFEQFKPVALDWIEFLVSKGYDVNMKNEIESLHVSDTKTLEYLQEWAENKNYDDLMLFNEFYPKDAKLAKFKWLNKKTHKEKMKEKDDIKKSISHLFSSKGVSIKKDLINNNIKSLYNLRDNIFSLNGEKELVIHTKNETFQFFVDKFNRVNDIDQGINDLTVTLENALKEVASLIIRQYTEDTFTPKGKKSKKSKAEKICNMYGAVLHKGFYRGLSAEEMKDVYTRDAQTGEYMQEPEGLRFLNWNVGNWMD